MMAKSRKVEIDHECIVKSCADGVVLSAENSNEIDQSCMSVDRKANGLYERASVKRMLTKKEIRWRNREM